MHDHIAMLLLDYLRPKLSYAYFMIADISIPVLHTRYDYLYTTTVPDEVVKHLDYLEQTNVG